MKLSTSLIVAGILLVGPLHAQSITSKWTRKAVKAVVIEVTYQRL